MPNPPLRKDFVDTRAPKINELPASEYNRHAGRTDAAYDEAFAASALAAAAMNLANQLAAGKVDKSSVTPFITGLFSATNQAGAQEILGFQPASSKLSTMLAAVTGGAGATIRVPLFSESGNSWTYINTSPFGRGLFSVADAVTLLANIGAVAKAAGNARVYIRNGNGEETTGGYANAATAGTFPVRDGNGTFEVGTPTAANHPVRKTDADAFGKVVNKVAYTGGATTVEYYEIARLPVDNNSNAASVTIQGRLGGWNNLQLATYAITLANRSVTYTGVDVTASVLAQGNLGAPGIANSALGSADIEVWGQADKSAIVYLKVTAYYGFDLRASGAGYGGVNGTVNFVAAPVANPPGAKIWSLSTAPKLEVDTNGQVSAAVRLPSGGVPASATAAGTPGQVRWDANYLYVCVAANTWKRTALATW